jgi:hypothetical protein
MQKKIIKILVIGIAIIVIAKILFVKLLSLHYWVGDYKISVHNNLKTVSILEYRCSENMVIPSTIGPFKVVQIKNEVFENNENISSLYIPSDIDSDVMIYMVNCPNLQKIEFAEGIRIINAQIHDCNALKEVIIPEGAEGIFGCFLRCESLEDIKFPSTLKIASSFDFKDTKFHELHENDKYYVVGDGILLFFNGDRNQDIVIPQGVKCFDDLISKDEMFPRNVYIPDTINILRLQIDDWDTYYFGDGEIEDLDLNCLKQGKKGTIVAPANSYMEQYCKENGYRFRVMTSEEEEKWRELTEAAATEITYQQ